MSIRALTLRYHRLDQPDQWGDRDDSELVRYCFKTSTTTTVQAAPASAAEIALQERQLELADFQLTELRRQSDLQAEFAGQIEPFLEIQAEEAAAAKAERERLAPIQQELLDLALEDLRRGGAASPEQIALIEEAGAAALEAGEVDIERFRSESLEALREELAPGLGLRPSDTPILDRGAKVAAEATRQGGQLAAGIRSAEATAKLNIPLASSQILQAGTAAQGQLLEATRQFQDNLRSSAISNRLGLFESVGGLGLGLATRVNIGGFPGFERGSTTTQSGGGLGLSGLGSILSGGGSLIGGLGLAGAFGGAGGAGLASSVVAAAPFFGVSSRDLKTDKTPIDEDEVLERVEKLPVEAWRYKNSLGLGDEPHIGTYAENFQESFGLGDGKTLNLMDTTGVLMASVKSLSKKVKKLETLGLAEAHGKVERIKNSLGLAAAPKGLEDAPGLGLREAHDRTRGNGLGLAALHVGGRVGLGLTKKAA